jgi:hypothetical protein
MKVDGILDALQKSLGQAGGGLSFKADSPFAASVRLGDVISGKVLRHYEGNRYGVSFGGQERIVDSAIPLSTNEMLYGKVIGLDDKVHLRRVFPDQPGNAEPAPEVARGSANGELGAILGRYRIEPSPGDVKMLAGLVRSGAPPELTALAASVLGKLGIPLSPELARAMLRVLRNGLHGDRDLQIVAAAPELRTGSDPAVQSEGDAVTALSALLSELLPETRDEGPESPVGESPAAGQQGEEPAQAVAGFGDGRAESRERQEERLAEYVLNAQIGGTVAHRLASFPIWFGGRLVEVNVALFSQNSAEAPPEGIRHRKLVISLDTESLGHIDVSAYIAAQRVRLEVVTETESGAAAMAGHLPDLKRILGERGWVLDEADYLTLPRQEGNHAVRAVVRHHLAHDSLSRLM